MTFGLALTIIFALMDYSGKIDWQWWQILIPVFVELGLSAVLIMLWLLGAAWAVKR